MNIYLLFFFISGRVFSTNFLIGECSCLWLADKVTNTAVFAQFEHFAFFFFMDFNEF